MRFRKLTGAFGVLVAAVLMTGSASATTIMEMNLETLARSADQVFRGTVLSVEQTTVQGGGGTIPAIKYTVAVDEAFKGDFPLVKDRRITEILMVGTLKQYHAGKRVIPGFPLLKIGSDYLLMVAPKGPIGLTATMGLGQGAFSVYVDPNSRESMAVNDFNNASLFKGMAGGAREPGAVSYAELVEAINAALAN